MRYVGSQICRSENFIQGFWASDRASVLLWAGISVAFSVRSSFQVFGLFLFMSEFVRRRFGLANLSEAKEDLL